MPASPSRPGPAYARIREEILQWVRSGHWRPGQTIPPERELMETFGCSRMTVHRALRELADEGVLERRRRAGTRVAMQGGRNMLFEVRQIERHVAEMGCDYRYRLVRQERRVPPPEIRDRLGSGAREKAMHVIAVHYANDAPFQLEDRWISLSAVPEAANRDFTTGPPGSWLIETVPWSDAEHVVGATNADKAAADLLAISEHEALLVIERRTWTGDRVNTFVRLSHPGRFYRLRTRIGV